MKNTSILATIGATLLFAFFLSWVLSAYGPKIAGIPHLFVFASLIFLIQWIVFVPSYLIGTEKSYDITASLTAIGIVWLATFLAPPSPLGKLLATLISLWAIRLGGFLYFRVHKAGKDDRFDNLKTDFLKYAMAWNIQALWIFILLLPTLNALHGKVPSLWTPISILGCALWAVGFSIETLADFQKLRFRQDPTKQDQWITQGLWSWSQHPNYFGEIILWFGITLVASPTFERWQYLAWVCPLFVYLLLTKISGIPMLKAKAEKRWGHLAAYRTYCQNTPLLWPWPPKRKPDQNNAS